MMNSIIFPNSNISLLKEAMSIFDIIKSFITFNNNNNNKTKNNENSPGLHLFSSSKIKFDSTLTSKNSTCKPCAVGEFEYDFTSSNPMNWNLQEHIFGTNNSDTQSFNQSSELNHHHNIHSSSNTNTVAYDSKYNQELQTQQSQYHNDRLTDFPPTTLRTGMEIIEDECLTSEEEVSDDEDKYGDELALDDEFCIRFARVHSRSELQPRFKRKLVVDEIESASDVHDSLFPISKQPQHNAFQAPISMKRRNTFDSLFSSQTSPASSQTKKESFHPDSSKTASFPLSFSSTTTSPTESFTTTSSTTTTGEYESDTQPQPQGTNSDFPYQCPECSVSFKVKSYLTRHSRKHATQKAFICPFHSSQGIETTDQQFYSPTSSTSSINKIGTKCHPTGGFSRRDTFKIHLKALHFVYPTGTRSRSRNDTSGRCAGCFKEFDNNNDWLTNHIMKNECPSMLSKYK